MKVEEIRAKLINDYGFSEEEANNIKGKSALLDALQKASGMSDISDFFDDGENAVAKIEAATIPTPPTETEIGWEEYVLSQFHESEMFNGSPKVTGLRRVVKALIGDIVNCEITPVQFPVESNRWSATAVCKITICGPDGELRYQSDAADAGVHNTTHPFSKHTVAMACSRAESRALRKLLNLGIISAEEIVEGPVESMAKFEPTDEPISETQINILNNLCKKAKINLWNYVNAGRQKYNSIEEVTHSTAVEMIGHLNEILRGTRKPPVGTEGYNDDWRTNNG